MTISNRTKKIPALATLIRRGKFDYVNRDITVDNFPPQDVRGGYKLFHFNKYFTTENAIAEMAQEGYTPANIYELLSWKEWNGRDFVIALGSVSEVFGDRRVPCLVRDDAERGLDLYWDDCDWDDVCRFLAVRSLELKPSENLNSLPLELTVNGITYVRK
jgi:hypothetical protein